MFLRLVAAGAFLAMTAIGSVAAGVVGADCQLGAMVEGECNISPWRGAVLLIISVLAGIGLATILRQFAAPTSVVEPKPKFNSAYDQRCPACGAGMKLRIAERGTQRGEHFLGCKRYPSCYGTAPASIANIAQDLRRQIADAALPVPLDATDDEVVEATRRYAAFLPDLKLPERWREESAAHHRNLSERPQEEPSHEG